jgi:hypothetical protein
MLRRILYWWRAFFLVKPKHRIVYQCWALFIACLALCIFAPKYVSRLADVWLESEQEERARMDMQLCRVVTIVRGPEIPAMLQFLLIEIGIEWITALAGHSYKSITAVRNVCVYMWWSLLLFITSIRVESATAETCRGISFEHYHRLMGLVRPL